MWEEKEETKCYLNLMSKTQFAENSNLKVVKYVSNLGQPNREMTLSR